MRTFNSSKLNIRNWQFTVDARSLIECQFSSDIAKFNVLSSFNDDLKGWYPGINPIIINEYNTLSLSKRLKSISKHDQRDSFSQKTQYNQWDKS